MHHTYIYIVYLHILQLGICNIFDGGGIGQLWFCDNWWRFYNGFIKKLALVSSLKWLKRKMSRQSRSSRGRGGAAVATKKQKCSIANIVLKDYMTLRWKDDSSMWTMIGSTYQLSPQRDFTEKLPNELIAVPHLKSLSEQWDRHHLGSGQASHFPARHTPYPTKRAHSHTHTRTLSHSYRQAPITSTNY